MLKHKKIVKKQTRIVRYRVQKILFPKESSGRQIFGSKKNVVSEEILGWKIILVENKCRSKEKFDVE